MAITLGDAVLFLRGDSGDLDKALGDAERKTEGFAGKAGRLLGGAVVAGAAAAGAAIVGIGAAAFSFANEVENASRLAQAQFGLTEEAAQRVGDTAVEVFRNNFANSVTEAANAVGLVTQQLGSLVDQSDIQNVTENAFRLRDAFGVDVNESISTVRTLMEQFGLDSQQAFDLVTVGFQRGLNRSDDFIDTINEYSIQFANAGASAEGFFGFLESGLEGGVLGTDKAADLFKEFFIRIQDGSDTTTTALEAIGVDSAQVFSDLSSGSRTAADVFSNTILPALEGIDDPLVRSQAGVALLGTQFEDIGQSLGNLGLIPDAFEEIAGATEGLNVQYQTLGAAFEGFKRQALVALQPLGDELLKIANELLPHVVTAIEWFSDTVPPIMDNIVKAIRTAVEFISGLFGETLTGGIDVGLGRFQFVQDWIDENMPLIQDTIETVLGAIAAFWEAHGDTIMTVVQNTFDTVFIVVETVLKAVLGIIRAIMLLINGDWEGFWAELGNVVNIVMDGIQRAVGNQLNSLRTVIVNFGPAMLRAGETLLNSLRDGVVAGFNALIAEARRKMEELRRLLPFSEPRDPTSPLRNLEASGRAIIEQIQRGMDSVQLQLGPVMPAMAGMGAGDTYHINVPQQISGNADLTSVRESARQGVQDALRARGL